LGAYDLGWDRGRFGTFNEGIARCYSREAFIARVDFRVSRPEGDVDVDDLDARGTGPSNSLGE